MLCNKIAKYAPPCDGFIKRQRLWHPLSRLPAIVLVFAGLTAAHAAVGRAIRTQIVKTHHGWELLRDGKPYFIKGAGGSYSLTALKACGGNSGRTWGAEGIGKELRLAARLHMTVTVGFWLGHPSDGFNYHDAAAVHAQYEQCRRYVLKYRSNPAVLMWGIGNEMENGYDHKILWKAVEQIARMCHRLDPNHPTMTVVAEIGGHKVEKINKYCPDIDIIGINSYGGGPTLYRRYLKAGGYKPYVITEYGPPGTWEIGRNNIGLPVEETSTQKAAAYSATYRNSILAARGLCLGGYAFTWGWKVEATPTWYGLILPDGRRLGAVDALQHFWTGHWPTHRCPLMQSIKLTGSDKVKPGGLIHATVSATEPGGGKLQYDWILRRDISNLNIVGGHGGIMPRRYRHAIIDNDRPSVTVKMPTRGGFYRLYCYIYNAHDGAAVGNIPLLDEGVIQPMRAPKAKLPVAIYGGNGRSPFVPSGWMGNYQDILFNPHCRKHPHKGRQCLEVGLTKPHCWGGIAWQDPADDWGKNWGGLNLTGAGQLSFWARGQKAGQSVTVGVGLIGSNQKYHDSARLSRTIKLHRHWRKYTLRLAGKNLSRIIVGFYWTAGANNTPLRFYLDQIVFSGK